MKQNNLPIFIKSMVLLQLALIAIIAALSADLQGRYVSITGAVDPGMIMAPLSGFLINNQLAELFFQESNVLLGGRLTQERLAGGILNTSSPRSLIGANIIAVAYTGEADQAEEEPGESGEDSINADTVVRQTPQEEMDTEVPKDCPVFLYCTHSAETYVPDSGKARLDGQKGLINTVAATLARECNKRGLSAVFIDTIHDYPNYNKSYSNSRHTVSNIVKSNPQIGALFDIHRDSIPNVHQASRVKINGEYCSQILIIVGSNERKPHPHWQKNYDFARRLYAQGEKMYPGLIKGVRTRAGTYNQEYANHALLLEFGTDYNTLEESCNATRYFTDILLEVLKSSQ